MGEWVFSKSYPITGGDFFQSLATALLDATGTSPRVVCVFREDIPAEIVLEVKVLWRFGFVDIAGCSVKVLSGGWWQTFTPGNFAFLLSPQAPF